MKTNKGDPQEPVSGKRKRTAKQNKTAESRSAATLNGIDQLFTELRIQNEALKRINEEVLAARQESEESRLRFEELYNYAPAAFINIHPDDVRIVHMNLTSYSLLKIKDGECRDRFTRYIKPDFTNTFHFCLRRALKDPYVSSCDLKMVRSDDSEFWAQLDVRGSPRRDEVRIAVTDISRLKKAEQVKDDFIGMVSHELRTPLTVIIGALKVAETKGIGAKERQELLSDAAQSAEDLSLLLDNLIELSRQNSSHLKLDKTVVDMESLLREIVAAESQRLGDHRLYLDIKDKLPSMGIDQIRLQQILFNLLDNAGKYSPAGTDIRLNVEKEDDHVLIGVSDKGPGIPLTDQAKLFEPFERLSEKSTGLPGLGLGLLVCKHLVEAHDGKIWVESKPGKGTTFWFTLPL